MKRVINSSFVLCKLIAFVRNDCSNGFVDQLRGAGQEVGRSCIYLEFKGKKILVSVPRRYSVVFHDVFSLILVFIRDYPVVLHCHSLTISIRKNLTYYSSASKYKNNTKFSSMEFFECFSFHLDHCGALPWFLNKTNFKGRCFMTHATKAIYKWLLSDCIRVRCEKKLLSSNGI